jgi:hypothetical protein
VCTCMKAENSDPFRSLATSRRHVVFVPGHF